MEYSIGLEAARQTFVGVLKDERYHDDAVAGAFWLYMNVALIEHNGKSLKEVICEALELLRDCRPELAITITEEIEEVIEDERGRRAYH